MTNPTHTPGELKACAHCDAAAPQVYASLRHVHCNVCGAVAPKAAWNQRTVDTELLEALKAAHRIITEIDDYMKRPERGDWGVECALCMGEILDDDREAIAGIAAAITKAEAGS